jgi:3',5'-cyclic AMP phosphodiesterase CpdA
LDGAIVTILKTLRHGPVLLALLGLVHCDGDSSSIDGGGGQGGSGPLEALPPLSRAPLTTEERLDPVRSQDQTGVKDPRLTDNVLALLEDGYGDYNVVEGEPVLRRTLDDTQAPEPGANAALITRFVHLADSQLADDESPARVINVDSPMGLTGGAFRPQEGHACRILNAAVRTINKIHEDSPLSLVLLGGDNADNAQANEVDWVLSLLSGQAELECDSGANDDPVAGPNNDPKDPFVAEGLDVPWVWVTGNHDILNQGNYAVTSYADTYLSDYSEVGARDWSQPGGPVVVGDVVADPARAGLSSSEILTRVRADGDGHGITEEAASSGRAYYQVDIAGSDVRLLVLDTAAPLGSAEGLIHRGEVDNFLVPALDMALAAGKYVIVTSHHASGQLTDGGGFGGVAQDDAVLTEEFRNILGEYPNVLMHLAGHTHHHKIERLVPSEAPYTYWEVETAALADFPHQMRVIEIWDLDNGFLSIRSVAFDYQTESDAVAEEGRSLGFLDFTSGWQGEGRGDANDRNVELYVPAP